MKKLFFLTLILLLDTIAALAQDRWTVDVNKYTGETVIYTKLVPTDRTNFSEKFYEVAAFIDGEARDVGMPGGYDKGILFVLHVKGNDTDKGKTITFKARNGVTGVEYNLTLDEGVAPVTYDGKTKNGELNPLKLNFTPVTALSLPESITVGKGKTVDLTKLITVTPAGAALPSNLEWDFANSAKYIKVENNILTGLNIIKGAYLGLRAGDLGAYTTVIVNNPVTAINIKSDHTAITVNKGDGKTLTDFLNNAYTLTPADGEGQVTWAIADTKIVQDLAPTAYGYRPVAAGTTTLTAQIMDSDGKVRIAATQKVTVTVVVPLEYISFNFNHNLFECNVGDDLTDYLNSILAFSPGDATNRKVTWSVNAGDAVSIQNGRIMAVKAGTASIRVSSVENTKIVADLRITVHNPATDVQFTNSTVNTNYLGSAKDISQLLTDNIKLLPVGFESISNLTVTSSRPNDVVSVGQAEFSNGKLTLSAQAIGVGDSKITVSFLYPDYLTTYSSGGKTMATKTISKSFNVHVDALANAININSNHNQEECNVGDDLTTYLNSIIEVLPSNAPDKSVKWSVLRGDAVTISNSGNIKASKAGVAILQVSSVANPQATANVTVQVHNPATDIQFPSQTLSMEYHGSEADISSDIKNNISFLPKGFESLEGLSVTSDKPAVVSVSNVSYSNNTLNLASKLLGVGTAKITVTITYRDYLADYTQPATTEHKQTVTKTFTVNVIQGDIPVSSLRNTSSRQVEECNVGNDLTSYLNSLIKVLPDNATDKQFTWSMAAGTAGNAVTIGNDGTIKATAAGQATLVATSKDYPQASATVSVLVHNPATDIQFANATIGMEYHGSEADISSDIKKNISFLPKGFESIDGLSVTSDKPAVVSVSNVSYSNNTLNLASKLLGVGTAKITVTISYRDYLADYTQPATTEHRKTVSKAFTVNVIQGTIPVSSLRNTSSRQVEECNVGNDLTSYLNSLIEVLPANATNKQYTWSVAAGTAGNAVTIGTDGTIKTASAGRATLVATSKDNPQATATVSVLVHNPATDIQFANATIGMEYHGSEADISGDIKKNISFLPKGFESLEGLSVTSDKPAVITVSNATYSNNTLSLKASLKGVGTAKITVTISYRDHLADYTQPATTEHRKTVTKTFTVNVTQGSIPVSSLRNTSSRQVEECNVGNDLTSYLNSLIEVLPANATNKQYTWSVAAGTAGNAVTIGTDGTIKAASAGRATLVATSKDNPQATATVSVLVHNPATDIQFANTNISMEYHGSEADISGDIKKNISFLPKGFESLEGLSVTSDKPAVITINNVSYSNNTLSMTSKLLGVGTAKITVTISYRDYLADYTQPATTEHRKTVTKTFTVNVTQGTIPVSSLRNTSSRQVEECNVGNDLTSHLNSLIEVLPANATNKQYKWSVAAGTTGNAVTIGSDGTVKAASAGRATLVATSKDNPQATATVSVLVHNPATDIQFANATIGMEYHGSEADISGDIKKNISFLPKGFESLEGLSVTSDKPAVITVSNVSYSNNALTLKASMKGVGTARISVTISYRDYLADYTQPATTEHRKTVTKTFTVNVTQGTIPVSSLRNTSSRQVEECNVGNDLTSHLNSLIEVLPANATNKQYTWSVAAGTAGNAVTIGNDGTIKASSAGRATLVATSKDNPQATATISVLVHNPATDIQFANTSLSVTKIEGVDLDISELLKQNISFMPKGFESVDGLTITSSHPNVITIDGASYSDDAGIVLIAHAIGGGEATITVSISYCDYLAGYKAQAPNPFMEDWIVTKIFTVTVTEEKPQVAALTYPDELTLSRYHDVALHLGVTPEGVKPDPSLIEIRISESANIGWGVAATAVPSSESSAIWNLRGRFTGTYTYKVYYNGKLQQTERGKQEGRLLIPAEYPFEHGWDWISLYAVESSGALPLHTSAGWVAPMQIDDDNYVVEIRSQSRLLYNDPEHGFFGDIEQLRPEDGMYKIHSRYTNEIQDQMIFSAGYNGLVSASTRSLPQARKGYTWITYPHELNHSLDALAPYLTQSAQNGDMIISRDAFMFYDGNEWVGPDDFTFEAGKGYIYYTESTQSKSIQWGPATLIPDAALPAATNARLTQAAAPWTYDAYGYPDCMAVIAAIKGTTTPNDYIVGAFVGDECRGIGRIVNKDGLLFIPVSGQQGERVTFRLYHQPTASVLPMTDVSLHFAARHGSLESPLTLSADATAIGTAGTGNLSVTFRDNIITASSAAGQTFLTVTDVQGKQVAYCQGTTLSLAQLPGGVYIVHVTDGYQQVTKKIKK